MSQAESRTSSTAGGDRTQATVCVLLACFDEASGASKIRRSLSKQIREGGRVLDEVVLSVSAKRKVHVHDPRRTIAGTLTPAITWGLFGLIASGGSWASTAIWAVIGAICGGLYAYYAEHIASKSELKRIGRQLGSNASALVIWAEAADGRRLLAATSQLQPSAASVAEIADDLSATVFAGAANPVELPSAPPAAHGHHQDSTTLLSMLLLRYRGRRTARGVKPPAGVQTELLFEVDGRGKPHVSSPGEGVRAMAKSDVVSWGLFGVAFGAIAGLVGGGGILGFLEDGVVTGIGWAIFGLAAGALYGLWAGRAVSARRLKGVGPLLPPDTSMMLAWSDGDIAPQTITDLSGSGAQRLIVRFNPAARGVSLEV